MRVYMHFEEEDPNYTAALAATGPETTLEDLLQNFLRSYVERFGEGAADLEAGSLELRSSKSAPSPQPPALFACAPRDARAGVLRRQKKLKRDGTVSSQVNDRDDVFVFRCAPCTAKKKGKPARSYRQVSVPAPATPPAIHRPPALQPAAARRASGVAATVAPQADDDDSDSADEEAARMRVQQQHMAALAKVKAAQEAAAASGRSGSKPADKFTHQLDRKLLGEGADNEIIDTSAVPTHEMNVQANCLKCRTHIFYTGSTALASCHACKLLHACVECPQCGTFFPAPTDAEQIACPVCAAQADLAEFEQQRARSMSREHVAPPHMTDETQDIHLIVQFYNDKSPERQKEVDECLRLNLSNTHIRHVHILTEVPMDLSKFTNGKGDKVVQYVQGNWLTYRDAVEYSSRFLRKGIVILANADIHFDSTLGQLRRLDMTGRCLALTRHDVRPQGLVFQAGAAPISQDAWVWRAPLPPTLSEIDFKLGKPGCDNRFAYELRRAGLRVQNPAESIKVLHLHASDIRNYVHGPDTVQGAYAAVIPIRNIT